MVAKTLACLGPSGSFSEEAARKFGGTDRIAQHSTVYATLSAVNDGQADRALLPIENALGGSVIEVEDYLLDSISRLSIVSEHFLQIDLCLIGRVPDLKQVRAVRSKAEAFQQCRKFVAKHLPYAALEPWHSTAGAVESIVASDSPPGTVAIASRASAERSGLPIIGDSIQDYEAVNLTRFVMLSRSRSLSRTRHDKTSIAFTFAFEDESGQLVKILNILNRAGVNMTKIASRPTRRKLGSYYFWVDFEGHKENARVTTLLSQISELTAELKVLGSYPRSAIPAD